MDYTPSGSGFPFVRGERFKPIRQYKGFGAQSAGVLGSTTPPPCEKNGPYPGKTKPPEAIVFAETLGKEPPVPSARGGTD